MAPPRDREHQNLYVGIRRSRGLARVAKLARTFGVGSAGLATALVIKAEGDQRILGFRQPGAFGYRGERAPQILG